MRYKKAPKDFGLAGPGAELEAFEVWGRLLVIKRNMALPKPIYVKVQIFFGHFLSHWGPLKHHKKNL